MLSCFNSFCLPLVLLTLCILTVFHADFKKTFNLYKNILSLTFCLVLILFWRYLFLKCIICKMFYHNFSYRLYYRQFIMGHDTEGKLTIFAKEKPLRLICHVEQIFMIDKILFVTTRMKVSSCITYLFFRTHFSNLDRILAGMIF